MRVQIIGSGEVGSLIAYTCLIGKKEISDMALYDIDKNRLDGTFRDLMRVKKIGGLKISLRKSDKLSRRMDYHIVCLGRKRSPGESDKYLFASNWGKVLQAVSKIEEGKVIVVTNPANMIADSLRNYLSDTQPDKSKKIDIFHSGDMCDRTKIDGMEIQRLTGVSRFGIALETYLML